MVTTMMRGLLFSTFLICAVPAFAETAVTVAPAEMTATAMGMALVDAKGMPLYTLETDTGGNSSCNGDCAAKWLPVPVAEGSMPIDDWSVVVRDDGTRMWAYKGHPLYTFVDDKTPGQVTGDNMDGFHLAI